MIENRNLQPGDRLIATYKGAEHRALVGESGGIILEDHRTASSVSQAAGMITGGSVNGWKFWSVAGSHEEHTFVNDEPCTVCGRTRADVIGTPAETPIKDLNWDVGGFSGGNRNKKRRSRRDAHTRELDRSVSVAPAVSAHKPPAQLQGQGFVSANICSGCEGTLKAAGGEYHERAWPDPPVCCSCIAKIKGRPCPAFAATG